MNSNTARHLTDEDILRIVAAGPASEGPAVHHAAQCPPCRARLDALTGDLGRLRCAAAASVPPAPRTIRLPAVVQDAPIGWGSRFGWRLAGGLALVLVVALVTLRSVAPPVPGRLEGPSPTAFREEPVMQEIRQLAENAFPEVYQALTADLERTDDDGFMDFVIPPLDDNSVS